MEVDPTAAVCPLCDAPIQRLPKDDGSPWPEDESPAPPPAPLNSAERMALARTITTLGFLIPVLIVLTVDWFVSRKLGWSLYVLASLGAAWLWAIIPLIFNKKTFLLIFAETAVALVLETAVALLAGDTVWLLPIGIPIVSLAGLLTAGVVTAARRFHRLGGNLAGLILIAVTALSVATDILVNSWLGGALKPGWSIIVAATTVPIAILLLYLHNRPSKQTRLRRYFHF